MMATRKLDVIAEARHNCIRVYSDLDRGQIESIEGVTLALYHSTLHYHSVDIDPRYDIEEIRAEIVALATDQEAGT